MELNKNQKLRKSFTSFYTSFAKTKFGFMVDTLPDDLYNELLSDALDIKNDFTKEKKATENIIGFISREYQYKPKSENLKNYIFDLCRYYEIKSENFIKNEYLSTNITRNYDSSSLKNYDLPKLKLDGVWINFQKKHEYFPLHNHAGVLSFVIWLDIPYTKNEEIEFATKKGITSYSSKHVGSFFFVYPQGRECIPFRIDADKSFNGVIAVFPSRLQHLVNPFYSSDGYRITMSGNLCFTNDFEKM